ncbi:MAG TPA: [protein-PII] uridylyltransferase [Nocardioidaceae bacterium]|nr:[protein-PII] uridylyltransferase [Nocardioidaceae bacterium]
MTAAERAQRTEAADAICAAALSAALEGAEETGVALVAVGGYGRRELAPFSDLDVVLVHADSRDVSEIAPKVWYPLWDAAPSLDHSVRAESEVTEAASADLRVALGLLDARHVAGDHSLTLRLRTNILAQWRRDARSQLPILEEMVTSRGARVGELGHASVPDLKESLGGLRDATVMNALVMTWLVDVPHADLERCRQHLLDVRDVLHAIVGRASDRIAPELWEPLAEGLGLPSAEQAQRHVRGNGRRLTHLSRLTWHRVDAVLARPSRVAKRAPKLETVAPGVAMASAEIVLDRGADTSDPLLLLRAAAEAAERNLMLAPATAARLARDCPAPPEPWSSETRNLFARLLAGGRGLLSVWETLEETQALDKILPEWETVRLLPHASVVHRFTVDRHMVETCIEAAQLIRRVARPDLLMVAAILHDIGKASLQDHSVAGEPVAAAAARRMGFAEEDVAAIAGLVRWHLLLADVATTRDLEDPSTAKYVAERVPDAGMLELLEVLTEADAKATGPKAWTAWRASLVADLVRRARRVQAGAAAVEQSRENLEIPHAAKDGRVHLSVEGSRVTVVAEDRVGLMAAVAGALAVQRLSVLAARAWTQDEYAFSEWDVDDPHLDEKILRTRLEAVVAGTLDPAARLRAKEGGLEPAVQVHHDASHAATVLEVRSDDRPGVVFLVCRALASLDLSVRSAHVSTLGPQTLDVFYVQEPGAGALTDERAADAVRAVRGALSLRPSS